MSPQENERGFREILSQKISGTSPGMWLLIPELLRLGAWDILRPGRKRQIEMAKKRKDPKAPSQKVLQSFFTVSAHTGQPIMATISSSGLSTTKATSIAMNI
jgi:hypothetical protein